MYIHARLHTNIYRYSFVNTWANQQIDQKIVMTIKNNVLEYMTTMGSWTGESCNEPW